MDRIDSSLLRWKDIVLSVRDSVTDTLGLLSDIEHWNGSTDTASRATGVMTVFIDELARLVFADELSRDDISPDFRHSYRGIKHSTVERVFRDEGSRWIDDVNTSGHVETRAELAARAVNKALSVAGGKSWGQMQTLSMNHPMAAVPIISGLLGLAHGPWPWGGTPGCLDASYNRRVDSVSYRAFVGPSWRFVIDFARVDSAAMVLPSGNSGNPRSDHFFDFFPMWRDGKMWTVPLARDAVYDRAASVLTLQPAEDLSVTQ
jgi:penicillin amidase